MLSKEQKDEFLTSTCNRANPPVTRYEYFQRFSYKIHKDPIAAQEAVSRLILRIYDGSFERLTESYCIKILKNSLFYENDQSRFNKKHCSIEEISNVDALIDSIDLHDSAERATDCVETETFYGFELHVEGKLTTEEIQQLESIRSSIQRLPLWCRELYDLYYIQGNSFREISRIKKIPLTSIYFKHKEMLVLLRKKLKEKNDLLL